MSNNQNLDQQSADWQPDQAIVFESADQPAVQPTQVGEPAIFNLSQQQAKALQSLANRLQTTATELKQMLQSLEVGPSISQLSSELPISTVSGNDPIGTVIEGYFDGEKMVAADGQTYSVPANYASKSKLVEGDSLKLVIGGQGNFVYKQIGPIERRRLIAKLEQAADGNYYAVYEHQRWRLLRASVSYFHAQLGDRIAILVPKDINSNYAALENLVAE